MNSKILSLKRQNQCILFFVLFFLLTNTYGQTIQVNIKNVNVESGNTVNIPLNITDVTGRGIYSYSLTLGFNSNVIEALGVSTVGTITDTWGGATYYSNDGEINISAAGTVPLTGSGILLVVTFSVVGSPGSNTLLQFSEMTFNEGTPAVNTVDGTITVSSTGICDNELMPRKFTILPAYPNPFNPLVTVDFYLPQRGYLNVKVLDGMGRLINDLCDEMVDGGLYSLKWHGRDNYNQEVSSGVYFMQAAYDHIIYTQKILKIK